ncbi:unnamed protein product [Nesidiocoris tenuis]|uniref:Uncharacterized protein n=1 Tax=Nesidiocoris tenuis TaxID=355587 RepID=A0A6H5GGF6_9HEMI|nr:unnamed protein product [Nesidiocoris tenuis]
MVNTLKRALRFNFQEAQATIMLSPIVRRPSYAVHRPPSIVRRPSATVCRPSSTVHGLLSTVHGLLSPVPRPLSPVHRTPSAVHHPPYAVPRPSSVVHRPSSTVRHPPSTVYCPLSAVHCPPYAVHRPPSTVRCLSSTNVELSSREWPENLDRFLTNYVRAPFLEVHRCSTAVIAVKIYPHQNIASNATMLSRWPKVTAMMNARRRGIVFMRKTISNGKKRKKLLSKNLQLQQEQLWFNDRFCWPIVESRSQFAEKLVDPLDETNLLTGMSQVRKIYEQKCEPRTGRRKFGGRKFNPKWRIGNRRSSAEAARRKKSDVDALSQRLSRNWEVSRSAGGIPLPNYGPQPTELIFASGSIFFLFNRRPIISLIRFNRNVPKEGGTSRLWEHQLSITVTMSSILRRCKKSGQCSPPFRKRISKRFFSNTTVEKQWSCRLSRWRSIRLRPLDRSRRRQQGSNQQECQPRFLAALSPNLTRQK